MNLKDFLEDVQNNESSETGFAVTKIVLRLDRVVVKALA